MKPITMASAPIPLILVTQCQLGHSVLYCNVLYCTVLYSTKWLSCTVLYCTFCAVLCHFVLYFQLGHVQMYTDLCVWHNITVF